MVVNGQHQTQQSDLDVGVAEGLEVPEERGLESHKNHEGDVVEEVRGAEAVCCQPEAD